MLKLSDTAKRLMILSAAISMLFFAIGAFLQKDAHGIIVYAKGVLMGGMFAILKVVLLEHTLNRGLNKPQEKAAPYVRLHFFLRYALTGVMLAIAASNPTISFLGAVLGLISLQFAAYASNFIDKAKAEGSKKY